MFQVIKNALKMPDLRRKLLYTLMIIVIFRIGSYIPVPFLDASALKNLTTDESGSFFSYLNLLSGGGFASATIFALSITPYITSSIIVQLLTVALPFLERLKKEGEEGRKKLNKITRYVTVSLGLLQAIGYYFVLKNQATAVKYTSGASSIFAAIVIVVTFTAGAGLIVWLGERINEKGIGNGISIILFAGIISRLPSSIPMLINLWNLGLAGQTIYFFYVPLVIIITLATIVFIIIMTNGERRIPVQYAKRVVGRKMYGGQNSHIPIKVSMSGVMPVIFASSILSIPTMISSFLNPSEGLLLSFLNLFKHDNWPYAVLYFLLIIGFNFFYVSIQYNPIEISNNLRKNNGAIPGIRPGKPTSDFISRVINKITMVGAIFLAFVAASPIIFTIATKVNLSLAGTSVIIVVGVALETMRTLESQMMMRHHKGFLE